MAWTGQKILIDSYRPGIVPGIITEIPLLPYPTALTSVASVLQQSGRLRKRIKGKVYVTSVSGYEAYITDYLAGTTGSLDNVTGTFCIETLGEPEYIQSDVVFFDCTWVEV